MIANVRWCLLVIWSTTQWYMQGMDTYPLIGHYSIPYISLKALANTIGAKEAMQRYFILNAHQDTLSRNRFALETFLSFGDEKKRREFLVQQKASVRRDITNLCGMLSDITGSHWPLMRSILSILPCDIVNRIFPNYIVRWKESEQFIKFDKDTNTIVTLDPNNQRIKTRYPNGEIEDRQLDRQETLCVQLGFDIHTANTAFQNVCKKFSLASSSRYPLKNGNILMYSLQYNSVYNPQYSSMNIIDTTTAEQVKTLDKLPEGITIIYDVTEMDNGNIVAITGSPTLISASFGEIPYTHCAKIIHKIVQWDKEGKLIQQPVETKEYYRPLITSLGNDILIFSSEQGFTLIQNNKQNEISDKRFLSKINPTQFAYADHQTTFLSDIKNNYDQEIAKRYYQKVLELTPQGTIGCIGHDSMEIYSPLLHHIQTIELDQKINKTYLESTVVNDKHILLYNNSTPYCLMLELSYGAVAISGSSAVLYKPSHTPKSIMHRLIKDIGEPYGTLSNCSVIS